MTYPGTVFFMQEDFFGGLPFVRDAVVVPEFAGVLRQVVQTPGATGFVRIRDAFELAIPYRMSVKVMKIKEDNDTPAIAPSRATIEDASYPIRRPYYVYHGSKSDADIIKYVDFVREKGWGPQNL
jgi:phosphate transport system substrate-binding protein